MDPARLYLPKKNGGLDLPAISHLYKKMHVSHAYQLITSCDPITQHVAKLQIEKEQDQQRAKFKPMLTVQEVMVADPGASKKTVMRRDKEVLKSAEVAERLEHSQSLHHQGELHRLIEGDAAILWSETVQKLPPEALKFALNGVEVELI